MVEELAVLKSSHYIFLYIVSFGCAPTVNGEDYYTMKGDYAIKGLVICDDAARITWVEMGWPGSVQDNCVWVNSEII